MTYTVSSGTLNSTVPYHTIHVVRRLSPQSPGGSECLCVFFLCFVYVALCSPGPTQYIFHTPMAWYSLYVLNVPLNTKQTNKQNKHAVTRRSH